MSELPAQFRIYQCRRRDCRFRFPMAVTSGTSVPPELYCPKCGAPVQAFDPLFANSGGALTLPAPGGPPVEALLDNIRSTYNAGAMFRSADGAGLRRLHLCGLTPTPQNPKVGKTALGAEGAVPWSYHLNGLDVALALKVCGFRIWALESNPQAVSLFTVMPELRGPPILLVVGNELSGVDPGLLEICDKVLAIPMQGQKRSLNVAIAFGIAVYVLRYGI